jgi:hypothetical protein
VNKGKKRKANLPEALAGRSVGYVRGSKTYAPTWSVVSRLVADLRTPMGVQLSRA